MLPLQIQQWAIPEVQSLCSGKTDMRQVCVCVVSVVCETGPQV